MTTNKDIFELLACSEYQLRRAANTIALLSIGNKSVLGFEVIIDGLNYHADRLEAFLAGKDFNEIDINQYVNKFKTQMKEAEEVFNKARKKMPLNVQRILDKVHLSKGRNPNPQYSAVVLPTEAKFLVEYGASDTNYSIEEIQARITCGEGKLFSFSFGAKKKSQLREELNKKFKK